MLFYLLILFVAVVTYRVVVNHQEQTVDGVVVQEETDISPNSVIKVASDTTGSIVAGTWVVTKRTAGIWAESNKAGAESLANSHIKDMGYTAQFTHTSKVVNSFVDRTIYGKED